MKKHLVLSTFVSLFLCATSSWFSYRHGVSDGFRAGAAPNDWAKFVMALTALNQLRANEVAPVIDRLESSCYSGANQTLGFNYLKGRSGLNQQFRELIAYRAKYAKPPEQWTPVESDLVARLKLWQNGLSTEMPEDEAQLVRLAYDVKHSQRP